MRILSVDLGLVRTGIAISDMGGILASPVCTIEERNQEILSEKIHQICIDEEVSKIVLGLPKNMDGTEGESAKRARLFGNILKEKTKLPVVLQDERCTTITAHNYLNITDIRGKKRKRIVDTVAATVILQNYLDSSKKEI